MKGNIAALLSFLLFACGSLYAQEVKEVSADEFEKATHTQTVQVLDVRTAQEYKTGHLSHALLADWRNGTEFRERSSALDKTKPVYVYCLSGGRSHEAAIWLQQQGYTQVYSMKGGINAWKQAGKNVEAVSNAPQMSLEEYKALTNGSGTYLVDFGAEWCPPCKKMEPVLGTLQKEAGGKFRLVKIDGGLQTNVMKALNVEALPVFILYKNGKEIWRKQGIVSLEELKANL